MINLKNSFKQYLAKKERGVSVNRSLRSALKNQLFPKKTRFIFLPLFAGAAALTLLFVIFKPQNQETTNVPATNNLILNNTVVQNSQIAPYQLENFACEGACQNLIVTGTPTNFFADPNCPICNEILLSAHLTGDRDVIILYGEAEVGGRFITLPEQKLLISEYPDWAGRTFTFKVDETGTVLNVILKQTEEWDLISNVSCVSGCKNIKVGVQRDINVLLIDTCSPKSCDIFSIASEPTGVSTTSEDNVPKDGIWIEDNNYDWKSGGYRVSVWQLSSLFAFNGDHGKEVPGTRTEYSHEQVVSDEPLHFDQEFNGRRFKFDLIPWQK